MRYSTLAYSKSIASTIRTIFWWFNNFPFGIFWDLFSTHLIAFIKFRKTSKKNYQTLNEKELLKMKKTDRVFILGSGYSLNSISEKEWYRIGQYDTLGFSGSFHLMKVPVKFHLFRGWIETQAGSLAWRKETREVCKQIENNSFLKDTIFVLQEGFTAFFSNCLIGYKLLPTKYRVAFFLPDKVGRRPNKDFKDGLVHRMTGLCSAISLAVALEYKEIVLVGVDLYDSRYFWLEPDKTLNWSAEEERLLPSDKNIRGDNAFETHNTVNNGVITTIADWHLFLTTNRNISISVYNPKSLLSKEIPVFAWDMESSNEKYES